MISNTQYKTHTKPFDYLEATTEFFTPEVYEKLTNILYSDAIDNWNVYNNDGSDPNIEAAFGCSVLVLPK